MYFWPAALVAATQLDVRSPNFLIQEYNVAELHNAILRRPIEVVDGCITPPIEPGSA